ncbi:MAG: Crp/Fnr family transcriptional regulator [Bacteroidota bacterium]
MKHLLHQFVSSFKILTPDEVNLIVDHADIRAFDKGIHILKEGQIASECFFVLKGLVREYYLQDGTEKTTAFFTEGMPVNSFSSATEQKPSKHYLVCAEDCVMTVGTESMEAEMIRRIPRLAEIIRQEVERNAGKMQDDLATYIMSSPEERYLNLLKTRPELLNRVPQHQIASFLGVKPESLSRIRKRLLSKKA